MRFCPARLRFHVLICLLSLACVFSGFATRDACAYIYDDFNSGTTIDTTKWDASDSNGLFAQSGGVLNFSAYKGAGSLVSKQTFGPGFFSMEFSGFTSDNMELPGSHMGAFAALGLTVGADQFVRIIRCQNGNTETGQVFGVFEVNFKVGSTLKVYYVTTNVAAGRLGMDYDGSIVTFYYDDGSGWKNAGWKENGSPSSWTGQWTPGWNTDPKLFIRGYDLTYSTSFKADNVTYSPVPEPGTILLLGGGLFGVAALRRRLQA